MKVAEVLQILIVISLAEHAKVLLRNDLMLIVRRSLVCDRHPEVLLRVQGR